MSIAATILPTSLGRLQVTYLHRKNRSHIMRPLQGMTVHHNALMWVENVPKFLVDFSDVYKARRKSDSTMIFRQ